ncbi:hypothetical protein E4U42_002807 [Claviceps africana]|uniref:Uncharacterized protein n=1 Tax=Claviceps africana TaxID=83212 RepID=A0A8K0J7I7_9HYPO|nr:hypothetical protein E4U42_002807 [Claviceps africana]
MTRSLDVTAVGWLLLSLAHTSSAGDWQANVQFQNLSSVASACAKAGWYQGSGFFIMNALINYAWSRNPALLQDPVHRAIAGTMVAIMWVSGWWYAKKGVLASMMAVSVMGALQGYSAFTV